MFEFRNSIDLKELYFWLLGFYSKKGAERTWEPQLHLFSDRWEVHDQIGTKISKGGILEKCEGGV